ncbi:MAG: hypothetical protein IPM08_03060 [Actinomycetales bacterium]|nr:hypothetical protein [Actinomycetales bacterium]
MLVGLDAGLLLAELPAPVTADRLPEIHGMVMVLGFLGALIALERAIALRRSWAYAAPALLGAGGLALAVPGLPAWLGQLLLLDGAIALTIGYAVLWRRQRDIPTVVQVVAAGLATMAALLWLRVDVERIVPLLLAFLVLTIASERVELARLSLPATADRILLGAALALASAAVATLVAPVWAGRAMGLGLCALVVWLARHDVARRTIASRGLPRFAAAAMLIGYAWLFVAGLVWLGVGDPVGAAAVDASTGHSAGHSAGFAWLAGSAAYDLIIHAVTLGFVMSMVLAHAPVILPAVLRRPLPFHPVLWAVLGLLHVSLLARVVLGDLAGLTTPWRVGAAGTVIALLVFPPVIAWAVGRPPVARRLVASGRHTE